MKKSKEKNWNSFLIVGSAFVGAFAARWLDEVLKYSFPINIAGLIFSAIIMFLIVRYIMLR